MAKKTAAVKVEKTEKNACPITLAQFKKLAEPIEVRIGDRAVVADVKEFSTGSFGWYINAKIPVKVGDVTLNLQIGANMTVVNSKEADRE